MKTTILNFLISLGFISLLAKGIIYKESPTLETEKLNLNHDTLKIGAKLDSIEILNKELSEKTYKTLQSDYKILLIKKKDLMQPHIFDSNTSISLSLEDSCISFSHALK